MYIERDGFPPRLLVLSVLNSMWNLHTTLGALVGGGHHHGIQYLCSCNFLTIVTPVSIFVCGPFAAESVPFTSTCAHPEAVTCVQQR